MLSVQNVWKIFGKGDTEVQAIKDISFSVEKGEFLTFSGPSGSGKTTLLNLIGCIDSFEKGDIIINDQNIRKLDSQGKTLFRRNNLGFIFQAYNLIPVLTVFENVAFPLNLLKEKSNIVKDKVFSILEDVGIANQAHKTPSQISGGQQQRVAIARALVKEPSLVLADEPTANLDSANSKAILDLMKDLNEKKKATFIFSTHDEMVMDYAKRILRIKDGSLIADERK